MHSRNLPIRLSGSSNVVRRIFGDHDASVEKQCYRRLSALAASLSLSRVDVDQVCASHNFEWSHDDATGVHLHERSL